QLAAALGGVCRGQDVYMLRELLLQQELEITRELDGLLTQRRHAGLVEEFQRRQQGSETQDRRIAELPAFRARHGHELGTHAEARGLVMAPPARETRQVEGMGMALMHEAAGHGAGA